MVPCVHCNIAGKGEIERLEIVFCAQYGKKEKVYTIFRGFAPHLIELSCIKKARKEIE